MVASDYKSAPAFRSLRAQAKVLARSIQADEARLKQQPHDDEPLLAYANRRNAEVKKIQVKKAKLVGLWARGSKATEVHASLACSKLAIHLAAGR